MLRGTYFTNGTSYTIIQKSISLNLRLSWEAGGLSILEHFHLSL